MNFIKCFLPIFLLFYNVVFACTGMQLKAVDGSIINGRTVEFGINLQLEGLLIPRNFPLKTTLPDGSTGRSYTAKYAVVGGSMFGETTTSDGINEKGLTIGSFYFPGYAQYATIDSKNKLNAFSPTEFPTWILTQFATIDEVKQGIKNIVIAPTTPKGWPVLPPFHYVVYEKTGKSIVIEPVDGKLKVYENALGVLTNSPSFDWHMTNLANYINLSTINIPEISVDGLKFQQFGEGSGLHGMPGDFTPPSRFVRAVIFSTTAVPANNAEQTVFRLFHILNQFDIPMGAVKQADGKEMISEYTLATVVRDPQNLKYYFRTFEDQTIKMINMNALDLSAKELKHFPMQSTQQAIDISKS